jgi:hypothetical protein
MPLKTEEALPAPRLIEVTTRPRVIVAIRRGEVVGGCIEFRQFESQETFEVILRWFALEESVEAFLKTDVNPPAGGVNA